MRDAGLLVGIILLAVPATAQQGSVQVSSFTQVVAADRERRAGQDEFEPDLGLTIHRPGVRIGTFFLDLHAVQRGSEPQLGTFALAIRDFKIGGLSWSVTGGDTFATPAVSTYAFTNLFAPQVTFAGASLAGFSPRTAINVTAGRVTALRNIFGSDPQSIGQDMAQFQARFRSSPRVEWLAHGSRVLSHDTHEFTAYVDEGSDLGGGARMRPVPTLEISGDAGWSSFIRRGATTREQSVNALAGAKWALGRGWLEVNAQRFSPGYFAVINTPYLDREGGFATGEFEIIPPLKVFGGIEAFRTNLDPESAAEAAVSLPRGLAERGFVGARLHIGGKNFLTLRSEQGDRSSKPVSSPGAPYDSDTGITAAEFQTSAGDLTTFARYERRENIDRANGTGTYTQQTASAQLFGRVTRGLQLFGSAMFVDQARQEGGQTFWQGGGGLQMQLPRRQLWVRGEALLSRTDDWGIDVDVPHELYTFGLSGQVTPRTSIAFDVMLDRVQQLDAQTSPWLMRSMIRLTYRVPTGTARIPTAGGIMLRRRGTASIFGVAFADWNGNGLMDSGEEPLAGVPFLYSNADMSALSIDSPKVQVTSGHDGQFAFVNVPEGRARVSLDLAGLPVDYDTPDSSTRDTEARGKPRDKIMFGLVPLGSIAGSVLLDADNDGVATQADTPVEGAVLVLDDGARSEQTRAGAFKFDAVRTGAHGVKLLTESLPESSAVAGRPEVEVVLDRSELHRQVNFLVKVERRPEIRKVFPPKVVAKGGAVETPALTARAANVASPGAVAVATPVSRPAPEKARTWYAIQLAATSNRARAWELVKALQAKGVEAYLSEDADGLAKVRVGSYRSRAEAQRDLARVKPLASGWIAQIGD